MQRRIVALHGNYYDNNFGDLLLLKVFERWIQRAGNFEVIYPLVPPQEKGRFDSHFPDRRTGDSAPSTWDYLIYAGGGLFADTGKDGRLGKGHFARRFDAEVAPAAKLAWKSRIPYAIIGPGAGPISNFFTRRLARRMFRRAALVTIRDEESRRFLVDKLGIRDGFLIAPDPALTTNVEDAPEEARRAIQKHLAGTADSVLLGIHHPRDFVANSPGGEALRRGLTAAIRSAPDVIPVIFTDIGNPALTPHGDELARLIWSECQRQAIVIPFPGVWETVALLSQLDAVITTKLHVGIVAYAVGTYVEAFPYHPKVSQFYRTTGRPEQCGLLDAVTETTAHHRISRAIAVGRDRPDLRSADWATQRKAAEGHGAAVATFLGSERPQHNS